MRIISGKYKSKRITAPKNLPARPTTDMAKEALFNILNNNYYLNEVSVLDLFAGIGSISLEFLSRGATEITAIDIHNGSLHFINKTAQEMQGEISTIKSDVYAFLNKTPLQADIIFADPPYDFDETKFMQIVTTVFERNLLNEDGVLIVEHSKRTDISNHPNFERSKKYGSSVFSFFKNEVVLS
jgi:16S rRNA (guanine(966)-N(2))-methyltransferase RsmD